MGVILSHQVDWNYLGNKVENKAGRLSPHHIKIRGRGRASKEAANKTGLVRNEENQEHVMVFILFNEQLT